MISLFSSKKNLPVEVLPTVYEYLEDLSIYNWDKVNSTGELKYLIESGEPTEETLKKTWEKLNNEYLKKYGVSELYADIMRVKLIIGHYQIKYQTTGDRSILNHILVREKQLEKIESYSSSVDLIDMIVSLEKEYRRDLDPKTISVVKYHALIDSIRRK